MRRAEAMNAAAARVKIRPDEMTHSAERQSSELARILSLRRQDIRRKAYVTLAALLGFRVDLVVRAVRALKEYYLSYGPAVDQDASMRDMIIKVSGAFKNKDSRVQSIPFVGKKTLPVIEALFKLV